MMIFDITTSVSVRSRYLCVFLGVEQTQRLIIICLANLVREGRGIMDLLYC